MANILICDDERDIVSALKIYLSAENYTLFEAYTGREALEIVRKNDIHLILMDIMMPEMDGISTTAKLREDYNIPIILLTAKSEDTDKVLGLNVGADDYITKPFSPSELVARVKAHLARYDRLVGSESVASEQIINIRGLKIDIAARRVWLNEEEITFTSKEFDMLKTLASHPNRVFSKEDLFRKVWGMEPVGSDISTIAVHIKKIREKIEYESSKPQYIETLWGVGYRFRM